MTVTDWDSADFAELDVTAQLNALMASAAAAAVDTGDGRVPENVEEVDDGAPFLIPMLIPEELESGDGRKMSKGALSTRNLPITLLWQPATGDGHNGSYIAGRIDSIEEVEGGLGNARGVFDTGPYGREAERLVRKKMLRGVSADLDMFEATIDDDGNELADSWDPSTIKNEKMTVTKARVMAATLVAKPAFQECTIELVSSEDPMNEDNAPIPDGVYEETPPDGVSAEFAVSAIIASAAPVNPPKQWFDNPSLDGPTPLTVDDDGRVFGHIATWDTDHVGMGYGVKPPRSRSNYAYFRTGLVRTIEGEDVAVGQLTLVGGHAPLDADARSAVKHYDDTHSGVADVSAGEDQFGIWVSGALRPTVTPEQVRVFRASAPSGDWRPINGQLELVAVCQVNVPGFPVARARVASGSVMALVAAGTATLHTIRRSEHDELADRVSSVERMVLARRKAELAAQVAPLREARIARLREAAQLARQRLAPELERRAQLAAQAEEARRKFAEFKVSPGMHLDPSVDWKEEKHPRDDHGKFRVVLAKLNEILSLEADMNAPSADKAKSDLERADNLESNGDSEGAKAAADDAVSGLQKAATEVEGDTSARLKQVADEIVTASKDTADDAVKGDAPGKKPSDGDITTEEIPEELKVLIDTLIDEFGENVDPQTLLSRASGRMRHWLEGKGFDNPEDLAKLIATKMQRPLQPGIVQ